MPNATQWTAGYARQLIAREAARKGESVLLIETGVFEFLALGLGLAISSGRMTTCPVSRSAFWFFLLSAMALAYEIAFPALAARLLGAVSGPGAETGVFVVRWPATLIRVTAYLILAAGLVRNRRS